MDESHDIDAQGDVPTDPTPVVPRADVTWEMPAQPAVHDAREPGVADQQPGSPYHHDPHVYAGYHAPQGLGPPAGAGGTPPPPPWAPQPHGAVPPPPTWGGVAFPTGPAPQPAGGPGSPRRGRSKAVRAAVALLVVGATTAAGIGIGHEVWRGNPSSSAGAALGNGSNGSSASNGAGGSGSGGSRSGGSNELPFGGDFPFPFGGSGSTGSGSSGTGGSNPSSSAPANVSSVAAAVSPALVDINTTLGYQNGAAAGTGIVITSDGEVLTNNHVIEGATAITATDVGNGQTYRATVVGYDRTADVAVLQLQGASGLKTATLGDSSKVTVGQSVVAVGNAGGVGGAPSAAGGSVTGLDQTITASDEGGGNAEQLNGMIEINAAIEPGDSGGSLVDSSGQVIGIDTAASTSSRFASAANDGYAIPINKALAIANQIVAGQGSSTVHIGKTAFLGVGVQASSSGSAGAEVVQVVSGSAAASAGIAVGDVITGLGGQAVNSPNGLTSALGLHHPGDQVQITWLTPSGQQQSGTAQLANGPAA